MLKWAANRAAASIFGLSSMFVVLASLLTFFFVHLYDENWEEISESDFVFQSNGADQFGVDNKNLFQEENSPAGSDVPPALPPKTGTPTRPPPPPPGQWSCARVGVSCVCESSLSMALR